MCDVGVRKNGDGFGEKTMERGEVYWGQFIGWSLFSPQIDPVVADVVSYVVGEVTFSGFDEARICGESTASLP